MAQRKRSSRLKPGVFPLAYIGVNPTAPVDFIMRDRPPTIHDKKNVYIGDIWLDYKTNTPPENNDIWVLVSLSNDRATWVNLGGGDIETLTGNTGGAVGPDAAANIDLLGETTHGITVTGDPVTYTLTVETVSGNNLLESLTPDAGGTVYADGNQNINIFGTAGVITTTGTPASHQIVIDADNSIATSYVTDTNTAIPAAHVLNVLGSSVINTSAVPPNGNNLYVNMTNGANGQVVIGGGASPAWADITTTTLTITPGANTLNIDYNAPTALSAFSAYLSATVPNVTGNSTIYTVIFDTVVYDVGGDYDNTTGQFTAPLNGVYMFGTAVSCIIPAGSGTLEGNGRISNMTSGLNFATDNYPTRNRVANFYGVNAAITVYGTTFVTCTAGDIIVSRVQWNSGALTTSVEGGINPIRSYFYGYLIYRT